MAQHELAQETGAFSDDLTIVHTFRPGVSVIDELCHVVLARNVRLGQAPACEPGEIIEVHPVSSQRALEMARSGEIIDGHSAFALLCCEPYLRSAP